VLTPTLNLASAIRDRQLGRPRSEVSNAVSHAGRLAPIYCCLRILCPSCYPHTSERCGTNWPRHRQDPAPRIFASCPEEPDLSNAATPCTASCLWKWERTAPRIVIDAFEQIATKVAAGGIGHRGSDLRRLRLCELRRGAGQTQSPDPVWRLRPEEAIPDLFRTASLAVMPYTSSAVERRRHLACQYGLPILAADIEDFRRWPTTNGSRWSSSRRTVSKASPSLVSLLPLLRTARGDGSPELLGCIANEQCPGLSTIHPLVRPCSIA